MIDRTTAKSLTKQLASVQDTVFTMPPSKEKGIILEQTITMWRIIKDNLAEDKKE